MNPRELRIGNWVYNEYLRKPQETYPMMIAQLATIEKDGKESSMSGIPLTPEWLERFGYTEISDEFYVGRFGNEYEKHRIFSQTGKAYKGFNVHFIKSNYGNIDESDIAARWDGDSLRSIQYVHQLQNLYFALTGEELNQKPDNKLSNNSADNKGNNEVPPS